MEQPDGAQHLMAACMQALAWAAGNQWSTTSFAMYLVLHRRN